MQYAVCLHFPDNHLRTLSFGGPTLRAALWAALAFCMMRHPPLDWSDRLLALGADATVKQLEAALNEAMALEPGASWSKRAESAMDHIRASLEAVRHLRREQEWKDGVTHIEFKRRGDAEPQDGVGPQEGAEPQEDARAE